MRPPYMRLSSILLSMAILFAPIVSAQTITHDAGPGLDRPTSFKALAKRLAPSVVNISTSQNIEANVEMPEFPKGSPLERFNDFFRNGEGRVASSLGSGFVIDAQGHIATNNHVIEGADIIEVTFPNGENYVAKLVGRDPQTDVALLKIETGKSIPFINWADSDTAEVGEWVMAIGNPFGYAGTVTAGIVSARNRNIDHGRYDDFIQSDVAINKGNSGGPLFDMNGDVVGMNTAILSPSGGSVGISFTTPSNLVVNVIDQLQKYGETRRGFLGVNVQAVTQQNARSYRLDEPYGAILTKVSKGGPAEKAGLKRGDLITHYKGKRLDKASDLALLVANTPIGDAIEVRYVRKRKPAKTILTIERLKEPKTKAEKTNDTPESFVALGISVQNITDSIRRKHRIRASATGVRVTAIQPRSDASGKLRIGDVIEEIEFDPIVDTESFTQAVDQHSGEETPVLLLINRGGNYLFYSIEIAG